MDNTTAVLLIVLPLVAWRVYARTRRMVGRQRSTARRHWIGIVIYSLLLLLLGSFSLRNPEALASLAGGVVIGAALAIVGLRLTRFEATKEGYFYTPNAHIGIALSVLFLCRIIYRFVEMFSAHPADGGPPDFARSPLTLVVFGMLAGYFVVFAAGVLRWRAGVRRERALQKAQAAEPTGGSTGGQPDDDAGGS
jgi:cytochrome b561